MAGGLYLIKRRERPEWHKAPYHRVIVCDHKKIAKWQAGSTADQAWVWSKENNDIAYGTGWLLERWNGLDIDYGHVVRSLSLPDGEHGAFYHPHSRPDIWALLDGAVWWSSRPVPDWLVKRGVIVAPDEFTQREIEREEWDYCPKRSERRRATSSAGAEGGGGEGQG